MLRLAGLRALQFALGAQVGQNEVLSRYQFTTAVEQIEGYLEDTVSQWQSA